MLSGFSRWVPVVEVADRKDEFEMNMRLIGAQKMSDLNPAMVDTSALKSPAVGGTGYAVNCECVIIDLR